MQIILTIFLVSLAGIVLMVVFKHIEVRTGKTIFLPRRVHDMDDDIKRYSAYLIRRTLWWLKHRVKFFSHKVVAKSIEVSSAKNRGRFLARSNGKLVKNGEGSSFLKQVNEHKNKIRNGDKV